MKFNIEEFDKLRKLASYANNEKTKSATSREYEILVPGLWQEALTDRLKADHEVYCGFAFDHSRISGNTATMSGKIFIQSLTLLLN